MAEPQTFGPQILIRMFTSGILIHFVSQMFALCATKLRMYVKAEAAPIIQHTQKVGVYVCLCGAKVLRNMRIHTIHRFCCAKLESQLCSSAHAQWAKGATRAKRGSRSGCIFIEYGSSLLLLPTVDIKPPSQPGQ